MIRLSWRQFRTQAAVAAGLLAVAAVLLAVTGPHIAHLYRAYLEAQASCGASSTCVAQFRLSRFDGVLQLFGTVLVVLPALLGAFWGAPLVARELETGTYQLAWTQSVSRTRWLAVKFALVGLASVATTGLLSLMVTWWFSPIDRMNADRFGYGLFGERNVAPLGYAAFAFALGVVAGLLLRRTLPAMAATLATFLGARLAFTYWIRPHLWSVKHMTAALSLHNGIGYGSQNGGPATLMFTGPTVANGWVYSSGIVDKLGQPLTSQALSATCPKLSTSLPAPPGSGSGAVARVAPAGALQDLRSCVAKLGETYHAAFAYQPASRYWTFQWLEMSIFLAVALVLLGGCFWWVRHRV